MRIKAAGSLLALFACSAFAQTDRVLRFGHTEGKQDISELATMIHMVTGMEATGDPDAKTLALHGSPEQIGIAEWLFRELDRSQMPAPDDRDLAAREFHIQGGGENTVRLFYLRNTEDFKECYWIATIVRTTTDMLRVGTYGGRRAIALRGTPDQVALAVWTVDELDRPAGQEPTSREYRMPSTADPRGETAVRIFHTANAATIQDFQEIATAVRNIADIRRVSTYNPSKVFIARASPEQIVLADWVLQQLDKTVAPPATAGAYPGSNIYKYDTPYDRDNMVRVFYLPQTGSVQEFQQIATRVRTTASLRRVFTYNTPRAMAVRGTADQVATAERMVKELDTLR
jgi:hypothetical protein